MIRGHSSIWKMRYRQTDVHRQKDGQTDKQLERQTNGQIDRLYSILEIVDKYTNQ